MGVSSAIAEPIPPHLGEFTFTDYFSYYRSTGNFLSTGTTVTGLPNGGYFQTMQDQLAVTYDSAHNGRWDANLGYGLSSAGSSTATNAGQGVTELSAGYQYWYRQPNWSVVPGIHAGYPFYRISQISTEGALISNASAWAEVGLWAMSYFQPGALYGYLGFRYQDGGLAGLLPFDFGASYRFPSARLRGGLRGETTIMPDTYSNSPGQRNVVTDRVDNFSERFYSVNPTVVEVYSEFEYLISREWEAGVGGAYSFYGANTSQGWTLELMVRMRLPGEKPLSEPTPEPGSAWQFQENTEKYNDQVFKESSPSEPEKDLPEPSPKPKPRKKKNRKKLDKLFRDTEKDLKEQ